MISAAIFPCKFTDGARVLGELSYTLNKPVYTDQMLLRSVSDGEGVAAVEIERKLFSPTNKLSQQSYRKEELINCVRRYLQSIIGANEDWIYYGFFSSLIDEEGCCIPKILIFADEDCRVKRAVRQEGITVEKALELIKEHDVKASNWTQFLFNTGPYESQLYDTVIQYECKDLLDIIAYIFLLHESMQQQNIAEYQLHEC